MKTFVIYLLFINVIAFFIYGIDKRRARKGQWRISENTLLGVALLGGSVGALFGMSVFHHKTRKKKFNVGVPMILVMQVAILLIYK
ncbi:MAG: DUF1294 domain-containing protein [Lachnospiraceae bacterium]|nr:DUF1294 domain-containing protein [Lachnospiraceae bacterium]